MPVIVRSSEKGNVFWEKIFLSKELSKCTIVVQILWNY